LARTIYIRTRDLGKEQQIVSLDLIQSVAFFAPVTSEELKYTEDAKVSMWVDKQSMPQAIII
jgi:hypothetical protein